MTNESLAYIVQKPGLKLSGSEPRPPGYMLEPNELPDRTALNRMLKRGDIICIPAVELNSYEPELDPQMSVRELRDQIHREDSIEKLEDLMEAEKGHKDRKSVKHRIEQRLSKLKGN